MKTVIVPIFVLVLGSLTLAGPLVPKDVPADAKWFGHVDVAAVRSSAICSACKDRWCKRGCPPACLKKLAEETGVDPMNDILGVTLYSTRYLGNDMILLIYCNEIDPDKLHAFVKKEYPDCETKELAGKTVCYWNCKRMHPPMPVAATVLDNNLIVLGNNEELLKHALLVLSDENPGLTNDSSLLSGVNVEQAFFVSQAIDVPKAYQDVTTCPILRKCTAAFAQWVGRDGQITGQYRLTANSEEDAANFKAVCDGFRAMLQLKYGDLEPVQTVLSSMKSRAKGNLFTAKIKTTEEAIIAAAQEIMEQKSKRCPRND